MAYTYFEQLDNSAKSRYKVKLDLINCADCPYKFPAAVWENDPCKWPPLQYGDLYSYLIDSPGKYCMRGRKKACCTAK